MMLSLPPPPPKETKPSPSDQIIISLNKQAPSSGPSRKTTLLTPPNQIIMSKQARSRETPAPTGSKSRKPKKLLRPQRTNPVIWCGAFLCVIFSLLLILAGITTLIVFLVIKPRNPLFDTTIARLNTIYLDSSQYLNGDFTFLANFSNPNHKIDVHLEYLDIELYFFDKLIGTQALQPFTQRRGEVRLETVHMISSLVFLPRNLSVELQKQVQSNRIRYNIRGTFRVRYSIGLMHFSYWLYGRCQLLMTSPPNGVLVARRCKTKR